MYFGPGRQSVPHNICAVAVGSDSGWGSPLSSVLTIDRRRAERQISCKGLFCFGLFVCFELPITDSTWLSGRGIGREMALELGRRGAKVIVNYANSTESAEEVVQAIKKNGSDAVAIKANVSDVDQIVEMFAKAKQVWGHLNIVCSNSGVVSFGHVKDVTPEEFDRVFNINTRGQFFVAREAYNNLEIGGRLILMGSITGQAKGVPKHAVYSGSKGTIETFVRCMAIDFGDKKITVNAVAPGGIKTDMYHAVCREYIPDGTTLDDDGVDEVCRYAKPSLCLGGTLTMFHSLLLAGLHFTVSVSPLTLLVSSASLLRRMASGSTARFWALTVLLACKSLLPCLYNPLL